jgi:hypothetical protein
VKHYLKPLTVGVALLGLATACTDLHMAPQGSEQLDSPTGVTPVSVVNARLAVVWNNTARQLIANRQITAPHLQLRILAYLSVAQYNAVIAAEDARETGDHPSVAAAVGGASVTVLTSFFSGDAPVLEGALDGQLALLAQEGSEEVASGEEIGRAVGTDVVTYAAADNFNLSFPPPPPVGPGYWTPEPGAVVRSLYGTRPFALTSPDQFRPPAPPAFGSDAFNAALDELLELPDPPTAEQLAIVQFWAPRVAAYMNQLAVELIESYNLSERKATRVLALANMAGFDAAIACWDAKFEYWLVRPYQVDEFDATITLPLGKPNHPSYPSGHSCNTAAFATVLTHFFPSQAARFEAMVVEAGLSRMYAKIHYRFDCEVGQELGRRVAAYALSQAVAGHEPIPLD